MKYFKPVIALFWFYK